MTTWQRLFDFTGAFSHPVTVCIVAIICVGLACSSAMIRVLRHKQAVTPETFRELLNRTRSWYVLSIAMVAPIMMGAFWVWVFFLLLSLFCFYEFARATLLNKSRTAVISVVTAILVAYFATLDHWPDLFNTSTALGIALIVTLSLVPDQPIGYIRRISLSIISFALFGVSLNHLAFISNDVLFRPIILWILICTELNDVFAYMSGKAIGGRKLIPNTSPNKTIAGSIGAILLTTMLSASISYFIFQGTELGRPIHLLTMGLLISVLGQCGDLVISSIKRDLGMKDMANLIPGHGGLLDRFDSLLIMAPVLFHYINYFYPGGLGATQTIRILSG
jgi:phosphatidate cytidylyltransferase